MSITTGRNHPGINVDRGDGQNQAYLVLSDEERAKGFVRPVRQSYVHVGAEGASRRGCGALTTMGRAIAETYARDPQFYGATFCCGCGRHLPVAEFVWDGTSERVGS
ncbi:hypothetical protein [Luteitalea sp.]|uniref:hypothetical protein n=1 Tax=Luteitalea sp. TaxID=2004800 RepID=UPI0025B84361|nr:hypothetical protein [Luteitalea sp.]